MIRTILEIMCFPFLTLAGPNRSCVFFFSISLIGFFLRKNLFLFLCHKFFFFLRVAQTWISLSYPGFVVDLRNIKIRMPYKNCKWEGICLSAPSTYRSARHANEYFNESGKIKKQSKRYFDPNDPFLWTSHHEQDCPLCGKS